MTIPCFVETSCLGPYTTTKFHLNDEEECKCRYATFVSVSSASYTLDFRNSHFLLIKRGVLEKIVRLLQTK